ncbi:MAG: hypothetical protein R6X25_10915 [Candidatus Krumholzibacteriia bacterium]
MGKTILVAVDSIETATLLRRALQDNGYRAVVVESGRSAMALARSEHPSLVVMDLGPADRSGLRSGTGFYRGLRGDPDLKGTPVVIIGDVRGPDLAVDEATAFIEEPVDLDEFLSAVALTVGG